MQSCPLSRCTVAAVAALIVHGKSEFIRFFLYSFPIDKPKLRVRRKHLASQQASRIAATVSKEFIDFPFKMRNRERFVERLLDA